MIREWGAVLVTGARDVLENVSPAGEELGGARRGPAVPRDDLDPVTSSRRITQLVLDGARPR